MKPLLRNAIFRSACCRFWYLLGVKKSHAHFSPLRVKTKFPDEHARPFRMGVDSPTGLGIPTSRVFRWGYITRKRVIYFFNIVSMSFDTVFVSTQATKLEAFPGQIAGQIISKRLNPGGFLPYMCYTGMCRSTGYDFCLSESGTGSIHQRFCLEQGILFAMRLWNKAGVTFLLPESRCKRTLSLFPLGSRCMFSQNTPFPNRRSTTSHIFQPGTGYLFSPFCMEQGIKIVSL